MKKGTKLSNFLKLSVIFLAVFALSYAILCAVQVSSGNQIEEENLIGNVYSSTDGVYYVSFMNEETAFYFDGEEGKEYSFVANDGLVVLSIEDIEVKFVALSEVRLYSPSVDVIFFLEGSEG